MIENYAFKFVHLVIAVVSHEYLHGYAALKEGDRTALESGRLSLNPLRHIDIFFTIVFPALLILAGSPVVFGAAKPVPINPYRFKRGKKSMALVSSAGIAANLLLALLFSLLLGIFDAFYDFFSIGIWINVILAVFNAIPIPPLDGSRILYPFIGADAQKLFRSLENYGFILIFLFVYYLGDFIFRIAVPIANIFFLISKIF